MKRLSFLSFFLGAVLAFPACDLAKLQAQEAKEGGGNQTAVTAQPGELLQNGDFKEPNKDGNWPQGWGSWAPDSGKTWEAENGTRFMRLASKKAGQLQVLYRELRLNPGKVGAMEVSLRYRTAGILAGTKPGEDGRVLIVFRDQTGSILDSSTAPLPLSEKAVDWTEVKGRMVVPENAATCIVTAGLFHPGSGRVDIGNIQAVSLNEKETQAMLAALPANEDVPALAWNENSNFSVPSPQDEKWPQGWGKAISGVRLEKEDAMPYMRLVSQEPGKSLMLYKEVPLKKGVTGVELKIRYRTDGILHGENEWFDARTIVNFLGADGQKVNAPGRGDFIFTHKPEKTDWIERTKSYIVPEGATTMQLMPGLFQAKAGTVDLAEIRVSPMTEANAERVKIVDEAYAIWKGDENAATDRKMTVQLDAQLAETGNLVPNGGFEVIDKNGGPQSWGKGDAEKGITWQEEKGEHFMQLVSQEPEKTKMLYRMVPLKLGIKGVEVKFRYRTRDVVKGENAPGDARVIMHFLNGTRVGHLESGKQVEPDPSAITFSAKAKDWTEVTQYYAVPEGATKLQLMPGLWNVKSGTLDIAEIQVKPMSDADATAMIERKAAEQRKKEERAALVEKDLALPAITPELKVSGNKLLGPDGKPVWLQGLCVDSLQWSYGESILWSIRVATTDWKANVIRLPVSSEFWFGKAPYQKEGGAEEYRREVDRAIRLASNKGAWVALDLHTFGAPTEKHLNFWKDAAVRYKNNPAVLFELFNEPHGISWEIWRDGGSLKGPKNKNTDVNPSENALKMDSDESTGMQALITAIRQTGAKNIIIAGGLDWGYDLTGVLKDYPLQDPNGNGLVYSSHIYPWKKDWQEKVLQAAEKYPLFIGEVGTPPDYSTFQFIPENERYPLDGWARDMIGFMQKYKLNWTGFSFHPKCGPMVIQDWNYTPTPYWGTYVREALHGKQFAMEKMR